MNALNAAEADPFAAMAGARELMQELIRQGHSIWMYTRSYRSPRQVKRWFRFYGIKVDAVINYELHEQVVGRGHLERYASKYPPAFDIDLHIDDLEGLRLEGEERGFRVVVVSMNDEAWAEHVLEAVKEFAAS